MLPVELSHILPYMKNWSLTDTFRLFFFISDCQFLLSTFSVGIDVFQRKVSRVDNAVVKIHCETCMSKNQLHTFLSAFAIQDRL
jgi:hypothetical protein